MRDPIVRSCCETDCHTPAKPDKTRCARHEKQAFRADPKRARLTRKATNVFRFAPPGPWVEHAACEPGFTELATDEQLRICAACPVRAECREYGLGDPSTVRPEANHTHGLVYGGRTLAELAPIARTRKETAA